MVPLLVSWPGQLAPGQFVARRKRFLVDVIQGGIPQTVHCANSGSMKSLLQPETVWTLDSHNPHRKLRSSLILMEQPDGLACVHTPAANSLAEAALARALSEQEIHGPMADLRADLLGFSHARAEVRFDSTTRFDFALMNTWQSAPAGWIEVKSVSLRLDSSTLAFPDAVTTRGQKHLLALMQAIDQGQRAFLWFVIMRGSRMPAAELARSFRAAFEIDGRYAELLRQAQAHGVQVRLLVADIGLQGLGLRGYEQFPA